jgi:hypothetical protein
LDESGCGDVPLTINPTECKYEVSGTGGGTGRGEGAMRTKCKGMVRKQVPIVVFQELWERAGGAKGWRPKRVEFGRDVAARGGGGSWQICHRMSLSDSGSESAILVLPRSRGRRKLTAQQRVDRYLYLADLGRKLARFGYHAGGEDGPYDLSSVFYRTAATVDALLRDAKLLDTFRFDDTKPGRRSRSA